MVFGDDPGKLRDDSGTIFSKNVIFVKNCRRDFVVKILVSKIRKVDEIKV